MDYCETSQGSKVRVLLTEDELQLAAIDDLCNKYVDWLRLSKESSGGRKTRSANRKADTIYDDIMAFKLPPIKLNPLSPVKSQTNQVKMLNPVDSSADSDSDSSTSRPITRSLRPRCRTPVVHKKQPMSQTSPSTPQNSRIRANMKRNASGSSSNSSNTSSNVLSAALNQQHPSVSVTKLRQLLRADSAQKKRDEEKERQERLRSDRKAKEERAEAQKKQLLEARAITAKLKREQRLLHAAELRKAREEARKQEKLKEEMKKNHISQQAEFDTNHVQNHHNHYHHHNNQTGNHGTEQANEEGQVEMCVDTVNDQSLKEEQPPQPISTKPHNETFQKPNEGVNNIDITIADETTDDQKKSTDIAAWAKAPYLRDALIKQFSKKGSEIVREAMEIFNGVKLPVNLTEIFGPSKAVNNRYICRTSSAVWSPPNRSLKRTSSMVLTPTDGKR